ncbi:MAG: amidohydrolase, partial [Acidobacteria bacterium]|nr:amidohydrolase [Acidobacteriota bacterium]
MKIDLHTHILPETWPDLKERYGYGDFVRLERLNSQRARMMLGEKCFREVESNCWDPAVRLEECDRSGVQVQVLSTVPVMFSYWAKPKDTLDLARLLNDHLAGVIRDHPARFAGLGTVPLQDPDLAARELERCVRDLGLHGAQIGTHVNDWNLDQPALFPFFQRAEELGAALFVHPWDMLGKERLSKYWLGWLVGMPAEVSLAICSMIFGGVLERLPNLRIAFAHGGGSFPGTLGRIERGFLGRPDLVAVDNPVNPRAYLGRFYVDSLVHDPDMLRHLLKLVGTERVALGSDYPFPLGEPVPGELIESLPDLTPQVRERLTSGTALEFLGAAR